MSYLYTYNVNLTATADDGIIATNNNYIISNQVGDLTSTNVLVVSANSEVQVQLTGMNKVVALNISSDNLFDVAISQDLASQPVYSGVFGNSYARLIKDGAPLTLLNIKASTLDAVVKLSVVGLETL